MNVVSIGGGTGLSALLRGLKLHVSEAGLPAEFKPTISRLTAIVTVTDEGGSSGRLRRDFQILPPGDIRNCMVALAEDEKLLTRLFSYRFTSGRGLKGHSFGNLFLAALTEVTHDFAKAVRVAGEVLAIRGEIFPSTLSDVRLQARLQNGRTIFGEARINQTAVPIRQLCLIPTRCRPLPETLAAIEQADLITLGPGSLYTSLIPNLLVRGIPEQIARSKALKVYVANLMTQPGESRHYTAVDHLRALHEHAGHKLFDRVVLNTRPISPAMRKRYLLQEAVPVAIDLKEIRALGVEPVGADLLDKAPVARHDPQHLARLLLSLASHPHSEMGSGGRSQRQSRKK